MTIENEDGEPGGRFERFNLTTRGSFSNAGNRITQFGCRSWPRGRFEVRSLNPVGGVSSSTYKLASSSYYIGRSGCCSLRPPVNP
jgi:hypothetical protein